MSAPHEILCSRTDAVLALYLDGDIGDGGSAEDTGFELVCPDTLATHLRDCPACQVSLQRARRLDAVLAENAGRVMAEAQAAGAIDRLLQSAAAGVDGAEPEPVRSRERSVPDLMPAAAMLALLVLLVTAATSLWRLWSPLLAAGPSSAEVADAPASTRTPTPTSEPAPSGAILVADDAARILRKRSARRVTSGLDRSALLAELTARLGDATLSAGERSAAVTELAHGSRPGTPGSSQTLTALVDTLAASRGAVTALAEAVLVIADEPHVVGYLRATLRRMESSRARHDQADLAALTVAVRIGSPELDAGVRRVARRHLDKLDVVAAALRLPVRARDGAVLLLDCWRDAARRHNLDDGAMARRLFAGQPREVFEQVTRELQIARSVPRRVHCLLALASCTDRQHAAALLDWATASCRQETYAAAWSLSQLPHAWLAEAGERAARERPAFVLRAALARAGLPAAEAWTEPMRLTPSEQRTLARAPFAVFPQVAEWFRDGRPRITIANY